MNKEEQLRRAKSLAKAFLYLPMKETPFSPVVVMHPFFENGFLYDGKVTFNALEDKEKYSEYISQFVSRTIEPCESVGGLLSLIRKSYRLTYLLFMVRDKIISKRECGNLLAEHWTVLENVNGDTNTPKSTVLSWLKAADREIIMTEGELSVYNGLPDTVTVYRGCRMRKTVKGMCWTLSEEKARWFANRFTSNKGGFVFRAQISKKDVGCYFAGRGEEEIVLDYNKLIDIERI